MKSIRKSRNRFIVLSLAIPVILLLMFVVYPSVDLVAMSFTSWDGISPYRDFVGVGNYVDMFTKSPDLWLSLRNNFIYLAVHMVMIPIELSIAVMLNTKFKGAGLVKTIVFLPFIINGVGTVSYTHLMNLKDHPAYQERKKQLCEQMWQKIKDSEDATLMDAEYYLMRFAPVGPGEKKQNGSYSIYNKRF